MALPNLWCLRSLHHCRGLRPDMSGLSELLKNPKLRAATAALGLAFTTVSSLSRIGPREFGVRETLYQLNSDIMKPGSGWSAQVPYVQFTHHYGTNTQKIEFNAGSCRFWPLYEDTADRNAVTARVALSYRVLPDIDRLKFHLWEMDGLVMQDGYWLLTGLMNEAANTLMKRRTMAETISDSARFARELHETFSSLIEQRNIPVEIERIEVKGFHTSALTSTTTISNEVVEKSVPARTASPQP